MLCCCLANTMKIKLVSFDHDGMLQGRSLKVWGLELGFSDDFGFIFMHF